MKRTQLISAFLSLAALWGVQTGSAAAQSAANAKPAYLDAGRPIEERVEDALARMTLEEKVALCHAQSKFSSAGVPRLGIPEMWMSDGPHGIRAEKLWDEWDDAGWTSDSCTAFPALTCLAATWNPTLADTYGQAVGEEARYRNKAVLLGPGVNIYRTPLNGRNFEYMGEDPFLASAMVVPYIQGVQRNGVAACVKHFAVNDQETDRFNVEVKIDDRTLHEIHLPAFKAAVHDGGVWAVMGSYSIYKGQHCCHNQYLLRDLLKRDWGFDGVVISDWGGTHDTREAALNGLDMEMGSWTNGLTLSWSNAYNEYFLADPFLELLRSKEIDEEIVNDKARRILRLMFRTTMNPDRPYGSFATKEHALIGRKIAQEGIVLLKNQDNLLPLDPKQPRRILVVGENAKKMMTLGGGSSELKVKYEISPLQGIENYFSPASQVTYAEGYSSVPTQNRHALLLEAVDAARKADVVIFVGGLNKNENQDCEGADRRSLNLPYGQDELIGELARVNRNLVAVIISGNAVAMPWVNEVPAIVEAWYGGTEAGNAIASVLAGEVNPSGKLPFTFPVRLEDNPAIALDAYPGDGKQVEYKEGIFVGYRWNDRERIKPLFCFGHGLSYTTFEYGKVTAEGRQMGPDGTITVSVPVKNTGSRAGAEIVQLYVSDLKSSLPRPVKELKGFRKITLQPGQEQTVSFTIDRKALSFYDDTKQDWVAEPGTFEALVGASACDIRGKAAFELTAR
ncbi:glycoside hydrolase family 3 C-terminal domain-containing protein [Alistipes indistinctus]|uniref:glycoside hydrolase family 3 C-terminal domain-containing protein n=1 Tax=Alistipes indistinctus TaxID=626932 RepID=UPI00266E969F|nr:glycoside hydrolase family 3 C-terminal domain-containing protein [Alistipes indistinctus]